MITMAPFADLPDELVSALLLGCPGRVTLARGTSTLIVDLLGLEPVEVEVDSNFWASRNDRALADLGWSYEGLHVHGHVWRKR